MNVEGPGRSVRDPDQARRLLALAMSQPTRNTITLLTCAALAACGGSTMIDSQRVAPVPSPITALAVVSQVGARGELAGPSFDRALQEGAAACGVRASVTPQLPPGAASVLLVTWTGGNKDRYGSVRSVRYEATLFESPSQRVLWRAELSLIVDARSSSDRASATLAHDLLAKLRRDQITPRCTTG